MLQGPFNSSMTYFSDSETERTNIYENISLCSRNLYSPHSRETFKLLSYGPPRTFHITDCIIITNKASTQMSAHHHVVDKWVDESMAAYMLNCAKFTSS